MIDKSKLAVLFAIAAIAMASPALSASASDASGAQGGRMIRTVPPRHQHLVAPRRNTYDFAPMPSQNSNSDFPALRMDREDY
jgi:hypothetical protein